MLKKIPVIQGSRLGVVFIEHSPGNYLPQSPSKDSSSSKARRKDVNDYVVGWIDVDGQAIPIAYTKDNRPEDKEILARLHSINFIH